MPEQLQIVISADVVRAMGGLDKVKQNFRQTADAGQKFGTDIARSTTLATNALQKLPSASNQATLAMTNLGRVVQDAPFGFLGIANNLNPLLESFQRLKQSTGTTGGALKALGGSLLGAGGLGFAISVVSSLLIVFGDRIFGAGKKAKEAKEALSELAKSVAEPIVKLTSLVGIIKNVNSSIEDKRKALQALNEQYGKTLDSQNKQIISLENLDVAYNKIIDTLLRQAVVKGLQEEIAKEVEKTAKAILAINLVQERERLAAEKGTAAKGRLITETERLNSRLEAQSQPIKDAALAQAQSNQVTKGTIGLLNTHEAALGRLKEQLLNTLAPLLNLTTNFEDLGESLKKPLKIKVQAEFDIEEFLRNTIRKLHAAEPEFLIIVEPVLSQKTIDNFFSDLKRRIEPEQVDLTLNPSFTKSIDDFAKAFAELGERGRLAFAKTDFSKGFDEAIKNLRNLQEEFVITQEFANALGNSFATMFDAIIAGKDPIKAFFNFMIQELQRLIAKLIATKIAALLMNLAFAGAGGGAGGAIGLLTGGHHIAAQGLNQLGGSISSRSFGNTFSVVVNGRVSGDQIILAGGRALAAQQRTG